MEVVQATPVASSAKRPEESLEQAVDEFRSILTDKDCAKLDDVGAVRGTDTVMIFTAQLDRENQLNKGRGVANRLFRVLQSVQQFSTVVETFVSSNPQIAALVWGSVKLAMLVSNFTATLKVMG